MKNNNQLFWFPTKEECLKFINDENIPFTYETYATAKNVDINVKNGEGYLIAVKNLEMKTI